MASTYNIPLNFAVSASNNISKVWLEINHPISAGQAMGVMGLTYSTLANSSVILKMTNAEGQNFDVPLNAY